MLVWWELQVSWSFISHFYPLVNETECVSLPVPPSGISMFSSLTVQPWLVEGVLHPLSPPVLPPLLLTGGGPNPLSCRLEWHPGKKPANHNPLRFISQIGKVTPGNRQKNSLKVIFLFFSQEDTGFNWSFPDWLTFFTDSESPLGTDLPLEQNSKVPQVFKARGFYK